MRTGERDGAELGLEDLIRDWDGVGVVSRYDLDSGSWFFIALHDDTLGRPTGGTRLKSYGSPAEGLRDAMRLAGGMTEKWAVAGVPFGGAKGVIAVPGPVEGEARRALLHRYGALVETLGGAFGTGEDLGTTPDDMAEIASATRHVLGGHGGDGLLLDPGPFTARGVLAAMRSSLARVFGSDDPAGRRVAVQGVGDVGAPLARQLAEAGAKLVLADTVPSRVDALARELSAETAGADEIAAVLCDVYAPCAVGATVNEGSIPRLACRIVCGSANNQLDADADADRLHRAGILYAPDYVANAGGAIAFGRLAEDPGAGREDLHTRVDAIRGILDEVFAEAAERDESPLHAARRRVERTLAEGRRLRSAERA